MRSYFRLQPSLVSDQCSPIQGVIGEIYPCSTSYQQSQGLLNGFDMFFLLVLLTIRKNTK